VFAIARNWRTVSPVRSGKPGTLQSVRLPKFQAGVAVEQAGVGEVDVEFERDDVAGEQPRRGIDRGVWVGDGTSQRSRGSPGGKVQKVV
jgi:hypothetical protein